MDALRQTVQSTIGDVALGDAWQVTRLSPTQLLVKPGDAWFKGLPFAMRSGSDQLVSGASLTVAPGITVTDDASGLGKILTFTVSTTPTSLYRIVVSAQEQIVTDVEDAFLKNANISESTGQKIRLIFKLNVVTDAVQTETPVPYTNDSNSYNLTNLVNKITLSPTSGQNGELLATNAISGSAQIDGRDVELTVRNDSGLGLGNPIPNGLSDQQAFYNGKLIDSLGNSYHINAIFNDAISTQVILRLDKEYGQPNPTITNGSTYTLIKRDVYVTDDTNGNPIGKLFWPIAKANWSISSGFVHDTSVTDLRNRIISDDDFNDISNAKFTLGLIGGGVIGLNTDGVTVDWSAGFSLINPTGPSQTINSGAAVIIDGGSIAYVMNIPTGGIISRGSVAITVTAGGSTLTLSGGPDLSLVRIGNVVKVGANVAKITAVDNVNKILGVSPSIATTGSGTVYLDSYAPAEAPKTEKLYTLAVLSGGILVIGNALELSAGQSNAIYDERTLYPAGLPANTNIIIPANSRNAGKPQYYSALKGNLEVYMNQLIKLQGVDWIPVDDQTIKFVYALPSDAEVHYRIDSMPSGSLGGGSGGGGGGTMQDAYNAGRIVNVVSGLPATFNAIPGQKAVRINGDLDVTGIIDPTGLELTPQASNPLGASQKGIWVNTSGELIHEDGVTGTNVSQAIVQFQAGTGIASISKMFFNNTGNTIAEGIPVYSPTAGEIAPGNGVTAVNSRLIGMTVNAIPNNTSGLVATTGYVELGSSPGTNGKYLYLDTADGTMTTTRPTLGPYSAGFNLVIVGIIDDTNIILKLQPIGTL